ncbi:hypothetical protein JTF04_11615 [Mammaliicoccus vitulinus]|uniref:hypothetical protein n=1 Tax=Mammaliicoccus vitulinus TaxID=71237 RepID=UPI0019521CE6|nr:hypothetical protein [Mammaliicoccus vitulinus]MBM6630334.1 hypothetical protein [Mammaliicoccus vitulinus]
MKKLLLATSLTSILLLGACGNNESESKESKQEQTQLTFEQEEKIQKEELRKVVKQLDIVMMGDNPNLKDIDKLNKAIETYENKTKNLEQINDTVSDPIIRIAKVNSEMAEHTYIMEEFKENNPELTQTADLASGDLMYHVINTSTSIMYDYDEIDPEYKNEILGKELNSKFTDLIFNDETILQDLADGLGVIAIEYSEQPTQEQLDQLPDTDYRDMLSKYGSIDEPDVSKNEYNSMVQDYNELAPEFLHYKEATELVSADENLAMGDIRNGIVGARTDSEVSDYEDDMEDTDTEEYVDDEEIEDEEEDEELKWVEDEDGEMHLEGSL